VGLLRRSVKAAAYERFCQWRDWEKTIGNPHPYTLLDASELKEFVNSDRYLGGLHNTANGHIHPLNLCIVLEAAAAVSRGANF